MSTSNSNGPDNTRTDALKLLGKLALIAVLLVALQAGFGVAAGYKDTPSPVQLCDTYLEQRCDIIYFGDSTLFTFDPADDNQAPINQMLQNMLPEYHVGAIAHDAYHLELYEHFCNYIAGKPNRPRCVVIPINLGTIGVLWDKRPSYHFQRLALFLEHDSRLFRAFYRPLAAFRVFNLTPVTNEEFEAVPVYDDGRPIGRVGQLLRQLDQGPSPENWRNYLIMRYMLPATPEHPKVAALARAAETLEQAGVAAVCYVTPVDYQTGNRCLGPRFEQRVRENARLLTTLAAAQGAAVLDLSCALPPEAFWWGTQYMNEHLNETGRLFVAERVARLVQRQLEEAP